MNLRVFPDKCALAKAAAVEAATAIRRAIRERGRARIIAATGASQFEFLDELTKIPGMDWENVEMFHLDEYIGLSRDHPASFQKYLRQRLLDKVGIVRYHLLKGDEEQQQSIAKVTA